MSPTEAYEMDDDTYRAFVGYMGDEIRARERAARKRKR